MISLFCTLYHRAKRRRHLLATSLLGIILLLGSILPLPGKLPEQTADRQPEQLLAREEAAPPCLDSLGDPLLPRARVRFGTCRLRHSMEVKYLSFSPDGKLLTSIGKDRIIHVWNTRTGALLRSIFSYCSATHLYFSPDGKSLASSVWNGQRSEASVWDAASGRARFTIKNPKVDVYPAGFSPDGSLLLTTGPEGFISFWDALTGAFHHRSHQRFVGFISSITFLDKEEALVVSETLGKLHLYHLSTGKEFRAFPRHPTKDLSKQKEGRWPLVAVSGDGQWLATCPEDGPTYVWNVRTGKERCRLPAPDKDGFLYSTAFSPNGKYLAMGAMRGIRLWDLSSARLVLNVRGFNCNTVRFSPDGQILAAGGERRIRLFDVATMKERSYPPGHKQAVKFVTFSPAGEYLASASDRSVRVWNVQSSQQSQIFPQEWFYQESEIRAQFSPDGRQLIARDSAKSISFWDMQSGKRLRRMTFPKEIAAFVLSPDGKHFLVETERTVDLHSLKLCETVSGKVVCTFQTRRNFGLMAFLPEGKSVVVYSTTRELGASLGDLLIMDAATGKLRRRISDRLEDWQEAHSLAISPEGRYLAIGSGRARVIGGSYNTYRPKSNPIQIWDAASGKHLLRLERHHAAVESLAWSPDGRILASASKEGLICLWEVASGKELTCYETLPNGVHSIAFSPNGQAIASAMDDTTVLLWDIAPAGWRKPAKALTARERKQRWTDLGSDDAETGYRAVWDLAATPADTVAFLKEQLHPVPNVKPEHLDQLIVDLDSDSFARREAASRELSCLGAVAEPALRKALKNSPSAELRRRAKTLLEALPGGVIKDPETLQIVRAIWVLQRIGTPEARAILEKLAAGAPAARQTQEAKAALLCLDRIKKR